MQQKEVLIVAALIVGVLLFFQQKPLTGFQSKIINDYYGNNQEGYYLNDENPLVDVNYESCLSYGPQQESISYGLYNSYNECPIGDLNCPPAECEQYAQECQNCVNRKIVEKLKQGMQISQDTLQNAGCYTRLESENLCVAHTTVPV